MYFILGQISVRALYVQIVISRHETIFLPYARQREEYHWKLDEMITFLNGQIVVQRTRKRTASQTKHYLSFSIQEEEVRDINMG
jgi:hypothetical protein